MSDCRFRKTCQMPGRLAMIAPGTGREYVKRYCLGAPEECARYMVAAAAGQQAVPTAMLPTETDRAWRLTHQA
ncbi:MAG: hypothetical protein NTV86_22300 [Planctomycetota bacterium]|nr:hypothetical protein [Planctomycetota bacterium]